MIRLRSKQWTVFKKNTGHSIPAFQVPFWSSLIIGSLIATAFYAAIVSGLLNYPLLRRYAMCHLVTEVSVYMFLIAIVSVAHKLWVAKRENRAAVATSCAINELVKSAPDGTPIATADWLETILKAQDRAITQSWLGRRLHEVVARQTSRGNCRYLEEDLRDLADKDADAQHESYGLVRIISWAMPMFGFLGTVIGISQTLGQMDMKSLASGSQEAMNSLTSGLYVAFDTTAVGLVLTMVAMFVMFGVGRVETRLLSFIDDAVSDSLQGLLSEDEAKPNDQYRIEHTVRLVSEQFLAAVERLVEKQADLWKGSMDDAQSQWTGLASSASDTLRRSLVEALNSSLEKFAGSVDDSLDRFERSIDHSQSEGIAQIDSRYHQWQSTLSEQARTMHHHHGQLLRQTELLMELIDKSESLRALEDGLQQNLTRLTDIDRFHEVAICLTEAVAVLGTQLERAGHLRVPKLRRVPASPTNAENHRRAA